MTLLQIYYWDWQWKDFENRLGLIFDEVLSKSLYLFFLTHSILLLDLSAAFDCVDHDILLYAITTVNQYIRGNALA